MRDAKAIIVCRRNREDSLGGRLRASHGSRSWWSRFGHASRHSSASHAVLPPSVRVGKAVVDHHKQPPRHASSGIASSGIARAHRPVTSRLCLRLGLSGSDACRCWVGCICQCCMSCRLHTCCGLIVAYRWQAWRAFLAHFGQPPCRRDAVAVWAAPLDTQPPLRLAKRDLASGLLCA